MVDFVDFAAGAGYGLTSVAVGQPMETVKTRMQASSGQNMWKEATSLFKKEGVRGLYRGGTPIFVGGTLFRSAQFGVHRNTLTFLQERFGAQQQRWGGFFDPQNALAGLCGGIGRGLVEGPFDYIKVRRQVSGQWYFREMYKGLGVTVTRNAGLFCAFVTYIDFSKQIFKNDSLSPFLTGAICSNLAWLTIWPLDVIKSQRQSGLYEGKSSLVLLSDVFRSGKVFRGIVPGLARSFLANGCSMSVYTMIKEELESK
mmetsp:Transcript_19147/g.35432  ORF Transcript_19147/g.35432 Transcript_19147/m.35432 type:complete len:256 (+) Transcript_19147:187-954(+)